MFVNVLLLVIGVYELLKLDYSKQSRIEETKGALGHSRKGVTKLNLVELGQELLVLIKIVLAMVLLFNSVGYPLVVLKAKLCEAVSVLKVLCVTLKDMVPPLGCLDSVIGMLASSILLSVSCYSKGGQTYLSLKHTLLLGNSHGSAADLDSKLLWDCLCITQSCRKEHFGLPCSGKGREERA
jgi:hypothetical protein